MLGIINRTCFFVVELRVEDKDSMFWVTSFLHFPVSTSDPPFPLSLSVVIVIDLILMCIISPFFFPAFPHNISIGPLRHCPKNNNHIHAPPGPSLSLSTLLFYFLINEYALRRFIC